MAAAVLPAELPRSPPALFGVAPPGSTPSASKSGPYDKPQHSKAELEQFGYNQRRLPPDLKDKWDFLKTLPKGHPEREHMWDLIRGVQRGDWEHVRLHFKVEVKKTGGTISH